MDFLPPETFRLHFAIFAIVTTSPVRSMQPNFRVCLRGAERFVNVRSPTRRIYDEFMNGTSLGRTAFSVRLFNEPPHFSISILFDATYLAGERSLLRKRNGRFNETLRDIP